MTADLVKATGVEEETHRRAVTGPVTAFFLVLALVVWFRVLGVDHWVASQRTRHLLSRHDPTRDPHLRHSIQLPGNDVYGRPTAAGVAESGRVILVLNGGCGECSEKSVSFDELAALPVDRVILVYSSRDEDIPSHYVKLDPRFRIVADPADVLPRELNASWLPRYYLLSGAGRLIGVQRYPDQPLDALLSGVSE